MSHPPSTHLRNKQETLNLPQISPPLTPPAPRGTPLPWQDQRPRFLPGRRPKEERRKAVAPLDAFCPVSFHAAPAKTPADPPVCALLTMTVHQLVESLWTVTREPGCPMWSLTLEGQRRPWAASGIEEQILAPIQENNNDSYPSGLSRPRMSLWREPGVGSSNNTSSGGGSSSSSSSSSWLSSSLRGRCPPLLARLRRHTRDESAHSEESYSRPQHLLRRWDNLEHKSSQDDDDEEDDDEDEDEEEEKEEGAVGLDAFGSGRPRKLEDDTLPELEDASVEFSPRRRVGVYENLSVSMGPLSGVESQLDGQKEKAVSSRDQEKLRKIKERLLLEDSDEEEGDLCRICQMGEESMSNPLIQPCRCTGSLQYVHQECIKRWLRSKIGSGTNLEAITTCELCKEKLRLNIDNFDIQELYRTHVQSEYDEFISSGLYLVVLLHFCEQRFSDVLGAVDAAGLFNLVRILHEHMDNLEIPHGESDEESRDNRPSIDFSDLDDDLEEEY
ncbi:E3 ubiquitin-protein ligase MARCH7 [Nibea albiflora]|uniref:E3 ubiquitin-protein ligase MARCH7 n=1 Tax=Nibea albiflora TaxID=240163 RepID=A0ACB7EGY7_NIBAL|nr:E3 ubiquitin-protein ligase MARCH7 [Nibea albiflora]